MTKKELFLCDRFKVKLGTLNNQAIPAAEDVGYNFEQELERMYYHQVHNYIVVDEDKYGKTFSTEEAYLNYYGIHD